MKTRLLFLLTVCFFVACARSPRSSSIGAGDRFPSINGESLEKNSVRIPEDLAGGTAILLIGYVQKAQFDIDRWILGLVQLETPAKIIELPTIAGMMPAMVQGFINNGMRSGIPKKDWGSVVTVFGDAEKIISAIGNERPQNAHVVVLDGAGRIRKVINEGYSAGNVKEVDRLVRETRN